MLPAFGIRNVGNTCYFNALLQALFGCPIIYKNVESLPYTQHYRDLIAAPDPTARGDVVRRFLADFGRDINFAHGIGVTASCAHETLVHLLDGPVYDFFKGQVRIVDLCECGHTEIHDESFYHLTSPEAQTTEKIKDYRCQKGHTSICTREVTIIEAPRILMLIGGGPMTITLGEYEYHLVSQIDHRGFHYTTTSVRDDGVFLFNDASVNKASLCPRASSFILMYY